MEFKEFRSLDAAGPVTVSALEKNDIQAANLFTTDPAIAVNNFVVARGPEEPVQRAERDAAGEQGGGERRGEDGAQHVSGKLDTPTLTQLMRKVAVDKKDPDTVAKDWLKTAGLV